MENLNRIQILAMEAGPDLDRLIYYRVLRRGFTFVDGHNAAELQRRANTPKPYSTDRAAAMEMIEQLQKWVDEIRAEANPLDMCRAALILLAQ